MPGTDVVPYDGPDTTATPLWWLSFADPELPTGHQFLGVVIIAAPDFVQAVTFTHVLGINPGGEVSAEGPIPPTALKSTSVTARLLTKDEALAVEFAE